MEHHMELYTYWIPHHKRLKTLRVPLLDTTVKSGEPLLAPTWEMVMGHKRGTISDEHYQSIYRARFDYVWFQRPDYFDWLITHPQLALGRYCHPGHFCHRYLLANYLKEADPTISLMGELTNNRSD